MTPNPSVTVEELHGEHGSSDAATQRVVLRYLATSRSTGGEVQREGDRHVAGVGPERPRERAVIARTPSTSTASDEARASTTLRIGDASAPARSRARRSRCQSQPSLHRCGGRA